MTIAHCFIQILEIKTALIVYSLSKAASKGAEKAAEDNELIALINSPLAVPWPEWGMDKQMMAASGFHHKQQLLGDS